VTGGRVDLDADNAARDLVSLVLTLVELIRQLLERQAVRRLDQADLSPEQEERLGTALMHLDQAMTDLCAHHGLRREDLNLHLGPLGPLLAENPW
jgi:CRISPR/Cas system-associated endonuclease Cas1